MNTPLITGTFLERLRTFTAPSHTNLENLPVSTSIMDPGVSIEQYTLYLQLMHDVVKDTEENIFPYLDTIVADLDARRKASLIESDLKVLNSTKSSYYPAITKEIDGISPAFALGIMYVIEGSSLGGRVILKNISSGLGYSEVSGAKYFAGYGTTTGSHWKSFLNVLTEYEAANDSSDEILAGADYAFKAIATHFTKSI